jgi:type II secretory pathway pseudopilin PulG
MFDSTRVVLSGSREQSGSPFTWLHDPNWLAETVDSRGGMRGFSMLELLTTIVILFVVSAMAVFQMQPMWQQIQANAGLDQVKSTLRQARELAISDRRTIVVQFLSAANGTSCSPAGGVLICIALTQMVVVPGTPPAPPTQTLATSPLFVLPIENKVQLLSFSGEPDTPDGFIGASPSAPSGLYAGSNAGAPTTGMAFQSDGTFTDGNGNPINLSIFLGEAGIPSSARAVTILGNTGRVFAYHGTGTAWFR